MGHYSDERGSNSNRGSQSALLAVPSQRTKWPKGKDFLFSAWAFVIGKNRHNKSSFVIVLLFVYTLKCQKLHHTHLRRRRLVPFPSKIFLLLFRLIVLSMDPFPDS